MQFKVVKMKSVAPEDSITEVHFEIAVAKAECVELLRIDIRKNGEAPKMHSNKKSIATILRLLKNMKEDGKIQFFATNDNFEQGGTESTFLQNKYPDLFNELYENAEESTIYIKL